MNFAGGVAVEGDQEPAVGGGRDRRAVEGERGYPARRLPDHRAALFGDTAEHEVAA